MIDLALLSPTVPASPPADIAPPATKSTNTSASVLARSRRPAILTYTSAIVDTASTLSGIPWYIIGWKKESEVLEVTMLEGVEFAKGWKNIPDMVKVVVEADKKMQFYDVGVKIVARFAGLRYSFSSQMHSGALLNRLYSYILYNHRIISYVFFTATFYLVSMLSTFIAYLVLSSFVSPTSSPPSNNEPQSSVKAEISDSDSEYFNPRSTSDFSNTSRTFPMLGRRMPLHFSTRSDAPKHEDEDNARIKEEEDIEMTTGIQPLVAEADDEDEEESLGNWRDSGIGTSIDEGRRSGVQKRRRALFGGGGGRGY